MSLKLKIALFFLVAFALLGAANNPKGDGLAVQGTDPTGNAGYPLAVVPATGSGAFPVSGTFWQSMQPVSLASMPSTPVTGTFWQATQPVSGTVTANAGTGTLTVSKDITTGRAVVAKTGSATTTSASADQVVLTYTVTSGKTFYLEYVEISSRLTTLSATGSILGAASLENPSGTKIVTETFTNPTSEDVQHVMIPFSEPLPLAAASVVRVVCTPAATTSMLWTANLGGYEK